LRCVDLTHPLHRAIPYWPGEGYGPFEYTQINVLERDGKAAGTFAMPEHMGTHIDAPTHFVASPISVDRLDLETLLRPAVVFDIAERAADDASTLLEVRDVTDWEARHGVVPRGAVALVHSGWSGRWTNPDGYRNDADGVMRFPAISVQAARVLVERGVAGVGVDTLSADNGEAPNSPAHRVIHGAGAYILENLANLDQLPESGAFVLIAPLPIAGGTGAPGRVIAFCDGRGSTEQAWQS
jgi:kynurenine formamidase